MKVEIKKRLIMVLLFVVSICANSILIKNVLAMGNDDPWLTKVMAEFEYLQDNGTNVLEWDVDAWVGRDLMKFWLKSSGKTIGSELESSNIELVYSHAVSPHWDQQFGVRHDFKPKPLGDTRDWLSFGYIGTAPYFVNVDARVFVGEESSTQLLIELEKETMLSQRWVLTSAFELTANGSTNEKYEEGSGLSAVEFSLRLGYEHSRKLQPFIGITARQAFGETQDFEQIKSGDDNGIEAMLGIHFWF